MNIIKNIRKVVEIQIKSLKEIEKHIGPSFFKAVKDMYRCKGKIIVTGVGKSGMIAQKIASTLTSTGTPAIFLHPVEGLHGSLGVVGMNDIVLAIGKSGESEELLNLIPSINRIGAKVICLTANKESSLAKQSSLVLYMPVKREACPLNLAPTTSSTVALVLGDAMAIALMKLRSFGPENFALFHPGGALGKRLILRVSDIMRGGTQNPVIRVDATIDQLLLEMTNKWTGAASIINKDKRLIGLVTDYDVRRAIQQGKTISKLTIRDLMNSKPKTIRQDDMALKALQMMEGRKKPFSVLPVIDNKKRSVGMIHIHDLVSKGLLSPSKEQ